MATNYSDDEVESLEFAKRILDFTYVHALEGTVDEGLIVQRFPYLIFSPATVKLLVKIAKQMTARPPTRRRRVPEDDDLDPIYSFN